MPEGIRLGGGKKKKVRSKRDKAGAEFNGSSLYEGQEDRNRYPIGADLHEGCPRRPEPRFVESNGKIT